MKTEIENIVVNDIAQLKGLLKTKAIYHMPKNIQIILNFPLKNQETKTYYEEKLSKNISECGCAHGSFFAMLLTLITILVIAIFLALTSEIPYLVKFVLLIFRIGSSSVWPRSNFREDLWVVNCQAPI